MQALVLRSGSLVVDEIASQGLGNPSPKRASLDATRDLVMGHEFCVEILDVGPGGSAIGAAGQALKPGDRVCSLPVSMASGVVHTLGYSNDLTGGFAERMVLDAALCLTVPADLPTELAVLTEPLSVDALARCRRGHRPCVGVAL